MNQFRLLLTFLACFGTSLVFSQEIHFTQFDMAPVHTNPALNGNFYGTARVSGIFRTQYQSTYKGTPGLSGEFNLKSPRKKSKDWISFGAMLWQDNTNDVGFKQGQFIGSVAYHLAADKKGANILSFGVQYGGGNQSIGDATLETSITNTGTETLSADKATYKDLNFGATLNSKLNKKAKLQLGLALNHLNNPKIKSLINSGSNEIKIPVKFTLHALADVIVSKDSKVSIQPAAVIRFQSTKASENLIQALVGYQLKPDFKLFAGPGVRISSASNFIDATYLRVGADYKDWKVGLAYDLTLSDNPYRNGIELAVQKILKIYKKPEVKPVIFCPDL